MRPTALTSVVALQAVGVVLVVAMLIIPGTTAYPAHRPLFPHAADRPTISVLCAVTGLYFSYHLDTAAGGMVVVTQGVAFTLVYLFAPPPRHHRSPPLHHPHPAATAKTEARTTSAVQ